jgi:hypothetical protein
VRESDRTAAGRFCQLTGWPKAWQEGRAISPAASCDGNFQRMTGRDNRIGIERDEQPSVL